MIRKFVQLFRNKRVRTDILRRHPRYVFILCTKTHEEIWTGVSFNVVVVTNYLRKRKMFSEMSLPATGCSRTRNDFNEQLIRAVVQYTSQWLPLSFSDLENNDTRWESGSHYTRLVLLVSANLEAWSSSVVSLRTEECPAHSILGRPVDFEQNARFIILIQEHVITVGWIQHNYGTNVANHETALARAIAHWLVLSTGHRDVHRSRDSSAHPLHPEVRTR